MTPEIIEAAPKVIVWIIVAFLINARAKDYFAMKFSQINLRPKLEKLQTQTDRFEKTTFDRHTVTKTHLEKIDKIITDLTLKGM